jgi:DNA helicase-2/ATP-dependent DNA helicase PcrA
VPKPPSEETSTADKWLAELNPQQRQAATHGEGPLLIIAGAGTGKTKTLAYRVAWLLKQGVPANRILLLTFTRRAAEEMISRARHVSEEATTRKVWGGTFHAVANRLLRLYGKAIKLESDFTVMDESDSQDLLNLVRADLKLTSKEQRFPRKATILKIYSRVVNSRESLPRVLKLDFPWCIHAEEGLREVFSLYTRRKQERQVLDYDDLLLFWNLMLESREVAEHMGERFLHILVDEYQDTNVIQAEILQRLRQKNHNITVVGDDAQSIYAFRAATIKNILQFPEQFPGTTVVTLEENYRSVQPILDVGNAVMRPAHYRYTKNLWSLRVSQQKPILIQVRDEAEQCRIVCEKILSHWEEGIPLHEQAVLFRAGHHSDQLEIELKRRDIPFHKYGGLRFLELAHIKDLVSFLRILENPRDEVSWFRVLELLEGIGPKTVRRFLDGFAGKNYDLKTLPELIVPAAAGGGYADLTKMLLAIHSAETKLPLTTQIERIRSFYDPMVGKLYENPAPRRRDLEQLEQVAQGYRSRRSFITDLTLDPPNSTSDLAGPPYKDEDFLILSTMHSAKGCEWKAVYVIHATDGNIPSDMAIGEEGDGLPLDEGLEEERRLFYVAITRAKDWLYVLYPLRYYYKRYPQGDGYALAQLTRFLTPEVVSLLDARVADVEGMEELPLDIPTETDIRGRISERWTEETTDEHRFDI